MRHPFVLALLFFALPAAAQSVCSSDGRKPPAAVLERFVNADCEACWRDPATPRSGRGELFLDWVVPGSKGEDAPLSAVALADGLQRLQALRRPAPARADAVRGALGKDALPVRIAQGLPFNDYVGTSIEIRPARKGPYDVWLLLVESLPAGTEGSPVPRNLVRNAFRTPWTGQRPLAESRSMQIHEGAQPPRLRLVALVADSRGRLAAAIRNHCPGRP